MNLNKKINKNICNDVDVDIETVIDADMNT
jgi:hypothetical protein